MTNLKSKTGKVHAKLGMHNIVCNCVMAFKLIETKKPVTCKHCLKLKSKTGAESISPGTELHGYIG